MMLDDVEGVTNRRGSRKRIIMDFNFLGFRLDDLKTQTAPSEIFSEEEAMSR